MRSSAYASEDKIVEMEIRKLVDDRARAVRARDVEGATSHIEPDILAFDVINPLRYTGADALRNRVEQWFSSLDGPIGFEVRDLSSPTGGDVAFSHRKAARRDDSPLGDFPLLIAVRLHPITSV